MAGPQRRGRVKHSELIDGLTPKQQHFVQAFVQTHNGTYAAKIAYNARNDNVAAVIASENFRKPAVEAAIHEGLAPYRAKMEAETKASLLSLKKFKREMELAMRRGDLKTGLKGAVWFGKVLGMWKR